MASSGGDNPLWLRLLASLRLAVGGLVLLAVVLALATFYESAYGSPAVQRDVYGSWWFALILLVLGINVAAAVVSRWPWQWRHVGFLTIHAAILVILAGGLVTNRWGIVGSLIIEEGQQESRVILDQTRVAAGGQDPVLPFAVRLDRFDLEYYPGTDMPRTYRSCVTVLDEAAGEERAVDIEMNRPLDHAGWTLLQSGCFVEDGRWVTVLAASRDPGKRIACLGGGLLVVGVVILAAGRFVQSRRGGMAVSKAGAGNALPGAMER